MLQEILPALQLGHGAVGVGLFLAFLVQGWLGWRIRRGRTAGAPNASAIRKHRRRGPILTILLAAAYTGGIVAGLIDKGDIDPYPLHLAAGTLLVALVGATYAMSRRIRGPASLWRTPHSVLGVVILVLFLTQVFLGLGVLL